MANLEAKEAEWVTILQNEDVPELATPDVLLGSLRTCFGDPVQNQRVEIKVRRLRQGTSDQVHS
ncbi:Cbp53E: Calbindin-32 [Crotalus adamanteus]|uniref:Cbp53E: Calbindin-32 n=1 Tax=Crotalus adamanteus TaxID=8729 RepID=A0AAW1B1E1_CROAD